MEAFDVARIVAAHGVEGTSVLAASKISLPTIVANSGRAQFFVLGYEHDRPSLSILSRAAVLIALTLFQAHVPMPAVS